MRSAIYARVSTSDQRPEIQTERLRQYTTARGFEVTGEFVDHGVSGAKASRPALDRLMAAARKREVDAVVVVKLDRLARSVHHLTQLTAELEALGVGLVVVDQAIDTTTPSGRLLFHMLGAIAEFERDLIRERTRAGVEAARRRGKRIGRPEACDRRARERIVRLSKVGSKSLREIGEMVGVSKSTVGRVLAQAASASPGQ